MRKLIVATLLAVPLFAAPPSKQPITPPYQVPVSNLRGWTVFSQNAKGNFVFADRYVGPNGGMQFDFYQAPASNNYVWYKLPTPINLIACAINCTMVVTVKVTGSGFIQTPGDFGPARMRCMVSNTKTNNEFGNRWWCNSPDPIVVSYYDMAAGIFTFTIPIQPVNFSDVQGINGSSDPARWATDFASIDLLEITFGGVNFFGHGNSAAPGSTFEVIGYALF